MSKLATILPIAASLALAPAASAQVGGDMDLDSFRPAIDSRGYVTVNASQVLGHLDLSFGLVTDWGYRVLALEAGANEYRVDNVISPTLQAAVGFFGVVEIGATVPFRIVSGTVDPDFTGDVNDPRDNDSFNFSAQGISDVGLHAKIRFLDTSRFPIGLAVIGSVYIPAGYGDRKWLGEGKLTPRGTVILDKEFGDRFRIAGNIGFVLRGEAREFVDAGEPGSSPPVPSTGGRVGVKSEIPFGVGAALALAPQRVDLVAEITGSLPLDAEHYQPLEALGALKVYLARNSFFLLGGGAGLGGAKAANPDIRAFIGIVFEPNIGDRDGDGIKDDIDKCPDEPEDRDGFEDRDGCPDPDNDRDGILDVDDKCPNDPEDKDGVDDEDGCPDRDANDRDGDGITDDVDKCPDDPEDRDFFEDEDGCPELDNDQDGILDVDDTCPNDPEDRDGFQDRDGCPDPDNDNDRILDGADKCPNEPETYNGNEDDDGCPDKGRVIVHQSNIEILDKIYFETAKAVIKPESFPILDAIAATLLGNPDIQLVEIQGHADERGADDYNLQLTDDRAHAVLKYLTDKGVEPTRLRATGYGETRPIDPGHNERAWSKNRRVEFVIERRAGGG
jgi:outer membrane protein OmpA-like peptidoglycan-associated protein